MSEDPELFALTSPDGRFQVLAQVEDGEITQAQTWVCIDCSAPGGTHRSGCGARRSNSDVPMSKTKGHDPDA
jgi:hypothetical protein